MRENQKRLSGFIAFLIIWTVLSSGHVCCAEFTPADRELVAGILKDITREKYPDADVVQADTHQWVSYKADGTYSEWYEAYVKVLTEKGKRRYTTVSSSYSMHYNTTEFTLVEVIRSDGTRLAIDIARNSSEMVDESQMEKNIYDPNNKVLKVSIPDLNIGDTLHFIMHDEIMKARMAGTFSDYILFEGADPLKRSRYTAVAPKEKPLVSIALKAGIPGTVTGTKIASGDEIIYTWEARDVPQAFEEPKMPDTYTQMQRLLVSTIPDWETVSSWYWRLCRKNIEDTTPDMEETVRKITAGITDPAKRIEAVFYWVSQEIRYLGITLEKESPGYEPHPVRMTFERRSGVCRDKAALLVAMLRLAGYEAYPVLIMNGPRKDMEVPQPFFNHAVSCVRNSDGTYVLMDSTDENTKELFPAYLNNQSYLVAREKGETLR
ncbi:MAG: DUF3857 domain-containing protein, partial [Deltaproteobacteria bacterium]|nr:DUF3857 domain-containing protein [Deltaproteobacteria bacterium]